MARPPGRSPFCERWLEYISYLSIKGLTAKA